MGDPIPGSDFRSCWDHGPGLTLWLRVLPMFPSLGLGQPGTGAAVSPLSLLPYPQPSSDESLTPKHEDVPWSPLPGDMRFTRKAKDRGLWPPSWCVKYSRGDGVPDTPPGGTVLQGWTYAWLLFFLAPSSLFRQKQRWGSTVLGPSWNLPPWAVVASFSLAAGAQVPEGWWAPKDAE